MAWYDYLREERARKLSDVERLFSRSIVIFLNGEDVSNRQVIDNLRHIEEIEAIFTGAGQAVEA